MSEDIIPTRPSVIRDPYQQVTNKLRRPTNKNYKRDKRKFLYTMHTRHYAELFGRYVIGVPLHWVTVKPFQLIVAVMGLLVFFLRRPLLAFTLLTMGLFSSLIGIILWLVVLTYWT